MKSARRSRREDQRGFTLIEVLIVVAIVAMVTSIAIPTFNEALRKSRASTIIADTSELYRALMRYRADKSSFPALASPPEEVFDLVTLAPLSTQEYFRGADHFINLLYRKRVLSYVAWDVAGSRTECFALVVSADQRTILVAAHTQFLPWGNPGDWYDGVYQWNGTAFVPLPEV